jgi:hypothetical protein
MGEANRFQRDHIDRAIEGVESVFTQVGLREAGAVRWPGYRVFVEDWGEHTWIRSDHGGIVEMAFDRGDFVSEGERLCTITDPFAADAAVVEAPFSGVLVGVLETPVVYPGNPLCHLATVDDGTAALLDDRA